MVYTQGSCKNDVSVILYNVKIRQCCVDLFVCLKIGLHVFVF